METFIALFIILVFIMFILRFFLPLFFYLLPIIIVAFIVRYIYVRIKYRSSSSDDQTYYENYDSDIIDVDFKVVDEEDTR